MDGLYLYAYYTNTTSDYEDYVWPEFGGALCAVLLYVSTSNDVYKSNVLG